MNIFAHVRWFVDGTPASDIAGLTASEYFFIGIAVLAAVLGLYLFGQSEKYKTFSKWTDKKFRRLAPWVPTLTRMSVGLLLVVSAWSGYFLAPNITVSGDTFEYLSWISAGIGLLLISGIFVRLSAAALVAVYLFSFTQIESILLLEHVEYLGLAVYLIICGGGLLTPKIFEEHAFDELQYYKGYALPALRIGAGLSLATLALSEKLLNLPLAQAFLDHYDWNFMSSMQTSDRTFIIVAGTIELIIGVALIFNVTSRLITLAVLGLFTLTALLLGLNEVVGHLFAVGLVTAVWANYPKPVKFKQLLKSGGKSGG